jgi:very-short-patch-repair endonuclease
VDNRRKPKTKEWKEQVSLKLKGIKKPWLSEKFKLNNPMNNLESREKVNQSKVGKKRYPFSDKWKMNMSKSRKGKPKTEQHKENISNSMLKSDIVKKNCLRAQSFIKSPSKPQIKLFNMIKKEFNSAELNFPLILDNGKGYSLDVVIPEYKIAIEYDGFYWHKDRDKDLKRQRECEDYGFKFIRYQDNVPSEEKLMDDINRIFCKFFS